MKNETYHGFTIVFSHVWIGMKGVEAGSFKGGQLYHVEAQRTKEEAFEYSKNWIDGFGKHVIANDGGRITPLNNKPWGYAPNKAKKVSDVSAHLYPKKDEPTRSRYF